MIENMSTREREKLAGWAEAVNRDRDEVVANLVAESGLDRAAVESVLIGLATADYSAALAECQREGFRRVLAAAEAFAAYCRDQAEIAAGNVAAAAVS
jgi:hypothetical protein